ncbi:NPP1 family protein [Streptomyces canus]
MRKLRPLATFLGALALIVAIPATAHANVLTLLPQNADGLEQTFSPAYDYDGDGCYATAAIGADGTINPGLKLGGDVNGKCHDYAQLANANTYSRAKCDNGWCAVMYASYFEKDQATLGPAAIGHTHDWEHVVVWVLGGGVHGHGPADVFVRVGLSHQGGEHPLPRAVDGPHPQPVVDAPPVAALLRQMHPLGTGLELEGDRVDHLTMVPPAATPLRRPVRE